MTANSLPNDLYSDPKAAIYMRHEMARIANVSCRARGVETLGIELVHRCIHCDVGSMARSSVLWCRPRIVLVSRRSSAIATAPRSTWRGRGSSWARPRAERRRGRQARPGRPAGGLALAAALRRGRGRRPAARRYAQARQGALGRPHRAPGGRVDLFRAAWRGHPLDRPGAGQDGRDLPALGAANLGEPWLAAAPQPHLQALQRPRVRGQARGHRRAVRRSAGPQPGALDR